MKTDPIGAHEIRLEILRGLRKLARPDGRILLRDEDSGNPEEGILWEGRYFCANGFALAVIASLTPYDWAAYIGSIHTTNPAFDREGDCCRWVARHGAKLPQEDARHYFGEVLERLGLADLSYRG